MDFARFEFSGSYMLLLRATYLCALVPGHPNYNPSESNLIPRPQSRYTPTSLPGHPYLTPQDIPTSLPGHPYLTPRTFQPHSSRPPQPYSQGIPTSIFWLLAASTGIPTSFISRRLGQTPPIVLLFHMFSHSPSNSAVVVGSGTKTQ